MMEPKSVVIKPPSPEEVTRVAKALHAASHVNEGFHGRTISPWSKRLGDEPQARAFWETMAIASIDMTNGAAARV